MSGIPPVGLTHVDGIEPIHASAGCTVRVLPEPTMHIWVVDLSAGTVWTTTSLGEALSGYYVISGEVRHDERQQEADTFVPLASHADLVAVTDARLFVCGAPDT
jgi:hypothetical protein